MKKIKRKKLVLGILVILVPTFICVIVAALFYFPKRMQATRSRPLVIIHSPYNEKIFTSDESILIHATARHKEGITRIELWADGNLVSVDEAEENELVSPYVLHNNWQPETLGKHVILVRAFSSDQIEGQSSIEIQVTQGESLIEPHVVEVGETLESIADDYGISEEEISELNPDLPPEGPAPGDTVDVPSPDIEAIDDGEPESESDPEYTAYGPPPAPEHTLFGPPPVPDDDAPGSFGELYEYFFGLNFGPLYLFEDNSTRTLLIEILDIETDASYESVNCYFTFAENNWDAVVPEIESSFTIWPGNDPLPFSAACVGIVGGGTDSVDLGLLALRIPSDHWDNIARREISAGGEGEFTLEYRISEGELTPKDPDPDLTAPNDVHLDPGRYALRWEYHPEPDEEPIWGFRIYLNGNLQWVEGANTRLSDLPPEWFQPPCGQRYVFTVTAYRGIHPDDSESLPGTPETIIVARPEDCQREVMVTFQTFNTFDLPGDGRYEDRTGDIGPAYGYFFSNERQATFDMGTLHRTGVGDATGLYENTSYDLSTFSENETRSWSGYPVQIVEVPDDEVLNVGFHIMDEDSGSGSRGEDDLICAAETVHANGREQLFDHVNEYSLASRDGRCEITYTIGPAPGSAVGSSSSPYPPLPWIEILNITYDDETEQAHIEVENTGTATWPYRAINIGIYTTEGNLLTSHNEEEFGLAPGESTSFPLSYSGITPLDFCVEIDPMDDVPELYEEMGTQSHELYCPPRPDLTITSVEYDDGGGGRLRVTIQNIGDNPLESRTLALKTMLADGTPAYIAGSWPDVSIAPGASITRDLIGVNENARARLGAGFSVIVDPDNRILETNENNNTYSADGLKTVRLETLHFRWGGSDPRMGENRFQCRAEHYFKIHLGHGTSLNSVEWTTVRFPLYGELYQYNSNCAGTDSSYTPTEDHYIEMVFPDDENIYVRFEGWETDVGTDDYLGEVLYEHPPEENYGEGTHGYVLSTGGSCNDAQPYGDPAFEVRWRIVIVE